MLISVASGKGGTGKTTLSTGLAWVASGWGPVQLLDCDVEEPDAHFYVKPHWALEREVQTPVPVILDSERCDGCGRCAEFCRYNALAVINNEVLIFPELCHGCGGCMLACPNHCLGESHRRVGVIRAGQRNGVTLLQGLLDIGEPMAVPVVKQLKESVAYNGFTIIDAPPGTGCSMLCAIEGSDFCILVTEPSPFGRHDLELAHLVARELGIRHGVVINKAAPMNAIIEEYCAAEGISVLGKIPYDRSIAESCSRGGILPESIPGQYRNFLDVLEGVAKACLSSSLS